MLQRLLNSFQKLLRTRAFAHHCEDPFSLGTLVNSGRMITGVNDNRKIAIREFSTKPGQNGKSVANGVKHSIGIQREIENQQIRPVHRSLLNGLAGRAHCRHHIAVGSKLTLHNSSDDRIVFNYKNPRRFRRHFA